jgi:tellurite resistance protein
VKEKIMTDVQADPMPRSQLLALTECMLSTAQVDGVHQQEIALIRSFYEEQKSAGMPGFDAMVSAAGKDKSLLASVVGDTDFAEQLVLMCLMTGYADGSLSEAERSHVQGFAKQLGVSDDVLAQLHLQVKDSLIASLAHLPEPESVAALAKTL